MFSFEMLPVLIFLSSLESGSNTSPSFGRILSQQNIFSRTGTEGDDIPLSQFVIPGTLQLNTVDKSPIGRIEVHQIWPTAESTADAGIGRSPILKDAMLR